MRGVGVATGAAAPHTNVTVMVASPSCGRFSAEVTATSVAPVNEVALSSCAQSNGCPFAVVPIMPGSPLGLSTRALACRVDP